MKKKPKWHFSGRLKWFPSEQVPQIKVRQRFISFCSYFLLSVLHICIRETYCLSLWLFFKKTERGCHQGLRRLGTFTRCNQKALWAFDPVQKTNTITCWWELVKLLWRKNDIHFKSLLLDPVQFISIELYIRRWIQIEI